MTDPRSPARRLLLIGFDAAAPALIDEGMRDGWLPNLARLRERVPALRHPVWTPHVTLARRVPQRLLPTAFEVLRSTETPRELIADRLRWWDPALELIEDVATAPRA